MFGWLFVLLILSALVPNQNVLPVGQPLTVGRGVSITPTAGWSRGSDEGISDTPGAEGIMIQKGGVRTFFIVEPYVGSTQDLHEASLRGLAEDLNGFDWFAPVAVKMGPGEQGLRSAFRGWAQGDLVEGVLASLSHEGSGISCIAVGSSGEVAGVVADLELMLETMGLPE